MQYRITEANAETGQILVTYFDVNGDIASYAIDVPIVNGAFIVEEELNREIMARAPVWELTRRRDVALAKGFEAITAVVKDSAPFIPLEQKKQIRKDQINAYRDAIVASGVSFMSYKFDSDAESIARLTALVASVNAGNSLPANFVWRSADNVHVSMNESQIVGLLHTITEKMNSTFNTAWSKKQEIINATSAAAVDAIKWSDPSVRGEA